MSMFDNPIMAELYKKALEGTKQFNIEIFNKDTEIVVRKLGPHYDGLAQAILDNEKLNLKEGFDIRLIEIIDDNDIDIEDKND